MKNLFILSAALLLCSIHVIGGSMRNSDNKETVSSLSFTDTVQTKTVKLKITGMTCAGCSSKVHTALSNKPGIISNDVQYPGDIATVTYDPTKVSVDEIIATVVQAGYKAEVVKSDCSKPGKGCTKGGGCCTPKN